MTNEIDTILCNLRNWPYLMADPDFGRKFKTSFAKFLNKIFYHSYCYIFFNVLLVENQLDKTNYSGASKDLAEFKICYCH